MSQQAQQLSNLLPFRLLPTHPTDWDPSCIPPPLNVRLDGCIVPSEASPQGARIAFSQLVVMDDLIDEAQRAELLHFLTAPPGEDQGPGHRASPTELGEHRVGREGAQLDAGTGQRDSMARMAAATPAQPGVCGGTPAPPPPLALPPHKWERRTTDMAGAAPSWGVRPAVLAELARMELPAMREVHARLCKLLPSFHIALLPSESIQVGGAGGHDHPQQHHPRQQGADPGSCCQGAVSSPPAPSPSVDCNAFVANAAMAGDTFAWHVDADPTSFPSPSPWLDAFGDYFNGEPGKPLLVSLMLYLNPEWEREWGAETLFMDSATDSGIFVIPRPRRAVLFHQDILHRVSPPSAAAAGRPRFSLVWKLALLPKGEAHSDSAAAPEPRPAALAGAGASGGATELGEAGQEVGLRQMAGSNRGGVTSRLVGGRGERVDGGWPGITPPGCEPPASFGSAARVDAVMRQLAGERKRSRQERG